MTSRVSGTLDLAATIRLSAGDDITRNCAGEQQRGGRNVCTQIQAVAAAVEKREEVADMAARPAPAQMGLLYRGDYVPPLAVVALPDRPDRRLDRFSLCPSLKGDENAVGSA